jgi:Uma2 family endonuclease
MQTVAIPESFPALHFVFGGPNELTEEAYIAFCEANPDLRVERNPKGEIVIMPPAGMESDYRNSEVIVELGRWSRENGRGKAFGPSAQFLLPDGSALSPDAAWVSNEVLAQFSAKQRKGFVHLVPEFIVEVMSPGDRLRDAQQKMQQWIANGVQLAWLIDGDARTIHIYRYSETRSSERDDAPLVEVRTNILEIAGEGPVAGFMLPLETIWQGLS